MQHRPHDAYRTTYTYLVYNAFMYNIYIQSIYVYTQQTRTLGLHSFTVNEYNDIYNTQPRGYVNYVYSDE